MDTGHGKPDVSVRQWGTDPAPEPATTGTGVLEPDLEASVAFRLDPQRTLHIDLHGQLIAALEIVSPRNKDRADAKETYFNRYMGYLRLGVHLMLVDVLPRPKGYSFADAITKGLGLDLPPLRRRSPWRIASVKLSPSATMWEVWSGCGVGRWKLASPCPRCRCL